MGSWPSHPYMRQPLNRIVVEFDWPTFVNTLRELHMACSQERMARELDVCTKTVWNWENDVVRPQWRHQSRLRRLGVIYKYRRRQWPYKTWVARWCDDAPPVALSKRTDRDRRRRRYRRTDRDR